MAAYTSAFVLENSAVADGGTTTNSGTDVVQAELRTVDDTTSYSG